MLLSARPGAGAAPNVFAKIKRSFYAVLLNMSAGKVRHQKQNCPAWLRLLCLELSGVGLQQAGLGLFGWVCSGFEVGLRRVGVGFGED